MCWPKTVAQQASPKRRSACCCQSLKGSTPPKMWEFIHCNTMRISEITPRKRYVLACELQKCQWGLPADRICFHKLSFVCFALRSYCEYVLQICITRYLENDHSLSILNNQTPVTQAIRNQIEYQYFILACVSGFCGFAEHF